MIALLSVGWQMYTYLQSRVRLAIDLSPNMQLLINNQKDEKKLISVTIRNIGGQPTTIQSVVIFGFKNRLSYICNKPSFNGVVPMHDHLTPHLPHLLALGTMWVTRMLQKQVEEIIKNDALKFITIGVYDSSSKKPKLERLDIKMLSKIKVD